VVTLLACGVVLTGLPTPFDGMLIPITMLLATEAELPVTGASRAVTPRMIAWRFLNTLIAVTTLLYLNGEVWMSAAAFGLFVVSCSGIMGGRALTVVTALTGVANYVLPVLVGWSTGVADAFAFSMACFFVSFVGYPAAALLLYRRSYRLRMAQQTLRRTVVELEEAQSGLRASEQRLQEWNQQLNSSFESQTAQLEERNRYLSIINAVSFALAEPMDDFRSLERASRLVARLMGARGAQAFHRFGEGESGNLFVTVAPEDVHAPRLPETLLRRVAETGTPVISTAPGDLDLPDLGEPYAVVPIGARGTVSGAFALLGISGLVWGEHERHLMLLVGREMGVSLENMRLYRDAIDRVNREEIAGAASRLLDVPEHREQAIHNALTLVSDSLDAWDIALLSLDEAGTPSVFTSLRTLADDGDWLTPLLASFPCVKARDDRSTPLILGAGGEAPLADEVEMLGIGTLVFVPIVSTRGASVRRQRESSETVSSYRRGISGVIVVAMSAGVPWRPASTDLVSSFAYSLGRRMENDELVALQQQRIRELSGLADVARTMQTGADVDRLYAGFAQALTGLLRYDRLYVARVDDYGQHNTAPVFLPDGTREDHRLVEGDLTHRWFSFRSAVMWKPVTGPMPGFVHAEDTSVLVVPMRPKGQVLGIVAFAVKDDVTGDQLRIVEQAVEQLALALDSATLYHQATERASHIQALSNLARIVASVVDLREAFAAFAEEVRWLIPFDRAVMLLLSDGEREVLPYATYPEESLHTVASSLASSIASAPMDASGAVFIRRSDPAYAALDWSILGPDVREVAAVPVRNGVRTAAIFALIQTSGSVATPDLDALDEVAGLLGVTIERLRLYERAEHSANHDLLTGLPNYRYLQERLYHLRAGISEPGQSAVLMIDMDGLKLFNDTLGHEAGDQVIRIVARELRATCRAEDFVARTGGDEFVVVMEGVGPDEAMHAAARLHTAMREAHLEVEGAPARLGVSIGIATAPNDAVSANRLLHMADQAMYVAKFSGGHGTRLARDHGEDATTRSIPQRDTHIVETMVRTATDGATNEERSMIAAAQRWVVGVVSTLDDGVEAAPWVRMVVAQEALGDVAFVREGRDQQMARFFLERLRKDWAARTDEVARAVISLAPLAIRLAQRLAPVGGDATPQALAEEMNALRNGLGPEISELHEALFAFVLAERTERRHERDQDREAA